MAQARAGDMSDGQSSLGYCPEAQGPVLSQLELNQQVEL